MAIALKLVGRQAELAQLREGLVAGRHQLIVGEAGVGKTRLATEAIASLGDGDSKSRQEATVLSELCSPRGTTSVTAQCRQQGLSRC